MICVQRKKRIVRLPKKRSLRKAALCSLTAVPSNRWEQEGAWGVKWSKTGQRYLLKGEWLTRLKAAEAKLPIRTWWEALKTLMPNLRLSTRRSWSHSSKMMQRTKSTRCHSSRPQPWWSTLKIWRKTTWLLFYNGRRMSLKLKLNNSSTNLSSSKSRKSYWAWKPQ